MCTGAGLALASGQRVRYSYKIRTVLRIDRGGKTTMDADEIRTLLGEMVFERAQKYRRRILRKRRRIQAEAV